MIERRDIEQQFSKALRDCEARTAAITNDAEWVRARIVLARASLAQSDFRSALDFLRAALSRCSREVLPIFWAEASYLMGRVYYAQYEGTRYYLDLALASFEQALDIYMPDLHPDQWYEICGLRVRVTHLIQVLTMEESMESVWGPAIAPIDDKLCFILMPFSDQAVAGVFDQIIKPVAESNGLAPKRADSFKTASQIMPDVWHGITTARVIVADLTNFNANVYYELGLCHALNKKPILMIQEGQKLPFDLAHFRTIFYSNSLQGLVHARKELDEFIKQAL